MDGITFSLRLGGGFHAAGDVDALNTRAGSTDAKGDHPIRGARNWTRSVYAFCNHNFFAIFV